MAIYRLQVLFDLRTRKKEEREQELAEALRALTLETKKLKQLQDVLDSIVQERKQRREEFTDEAFNHDLTSLQATGHENYAERLRNKEARQQEAINAQRAIVTLRQKDLDQARQNLIKADQNLKALEKHRENFLREQKKALIRAEEEVSDEIAQTIFLREEKNQKDS